MGGYGWFVGRVELPSEHADVKVEIGKSSHAGAQSQKDVPLEKTSLTGWNVLTDKIWSHKT